MHMMSAALAIALLTSNPGPMQAREVVSKASVARSAKAKVVPQALPSKTGQRSSSDAQRRAYSDMVEDVATSAADFADDNTTGNQDRDHLADPSAGTSKEEPGQ